MYITIQLTINVHIINIGIVISIKNIINNYYIQIYHYYRHCDSITTIDKNREYIQYYKNYKFNTIQNIQL